MFKKLVSMVLAMISVMSLVCVPGFAEADLGLLLGVSANEPIEEIFLRGTSIPSNVWNIPNSGRYNFAGTSNIQNLYTNYRFTGKNSYTVRVINNSDYSLEVKVKREFNTYSSNTFAPHSDQTYSVTGMNSSNTFYILFQGSYQDFSGYIE